MSEKITVGVQLHPIQYRALMKIAQTKTTDMSRPVQVHHLVEHLVVSALNPPSRVRTRRDLVDAAALIAAHAEGLNDRELAERLGFSVTAIKRNRYKLQLPANAQPGRPRRKETTA